MQWKSDFERTSLSSYSTKTGAKVSQSADSHEQIRYYYCNRSGTYVPKAKRKRQLKVQGSAKLGHYCTSYIKTRENVNTGGIVAEVCETHYGHEQELRHLRIPQQTRVNIASMLSQGVTSKGVLETIRDNCDIGITRDHLVTPMDITNIRHSFNVHGIERHGNDQTSHTYSIIQQSTWF